MSEVCEICGNNFSIAGQLWINKLFDKEFIGKSVTHRVRERRYSSNEGDGSLLQVIVDMSG